MRKVIAGFAASLDGYIEGPAGEYDWILIDKDIDFAAQMARFDTFLFGRKSYERVRPMGGKKTPGVTNYVFSRTLTTVDEAYQLARDAGQTVAQLKTQAGKDIAVFGGAHLLASLLALQLVDELEVSVIPVLLGQGTPLVARLPQKVWLQLRGHKIFGNGTAQLIYRVVYSQR